jgi:DNA-binding transcriptional ArsR family regulator
VYSVLEAKMPVPHPLPEPLVELVAQRFRLIGEPMRIRLLDRLRDGEQSVGELVEALDATQQNISKHLGVLHQAGILGRRKEGNRVVYAIADASIFTLCETVCGGLAQQVAELSLLLEGAVDEQGAAR